jgi:hypothetical protein
MFGPFCDGARNGGISVAARNHPYGIQQLAVGAQVLH